MATAICGSKEVKWVCIICCKSVVNHVNENVKGPSRTGVKVFLRQLGVVPQIELDWIKTCLDCSLLLEGFGKIYNDWKVLELELQCRLTEISNIVRSAGRIPKRVKAFKAWCEDQDNTNKDKVGTALIQLRRNLRCESLKVNTKFLPRVYLQRIDQNAIVPEGNPLGRAIDTKALLLGWIASFVAVTTLTDFNQGDSTAKNDKQPEDFPVEDKSPECAKANNARVVKQYIPGEQIGRRRRQKQVTPRSSLHPASSVAITNPNVFHRYSCSMCPAKYKWKKNLVRHIKFTHISSLNLNPGDSSSALDKPESSFSAPRPMEPSSELSVTTRQVSKGPTEKKRAWRVKPITPVRCKKCETWFVDKLILRRHAKFCNFTTETIARQDPTTQTVAPIELNGDIYQVRKSVVSRRPVIIKPRKKTICICKKCGRQLSSVHSLKRHLEENGCSYTKKRALIRLNSSLHFICEFCNLELRERSNLERHVASCHRFHHENARDHRHLDITKGEAAGVFFCAYCGQRHEAARNLSRHLRAEHFKIMGVPKKKTNSNEKDVPDAFEEAVPIDNFRIGEAGVVQPENPDCDKKEISELPRSSKQVSKGAITKKNGNKLKPWTPVCCEKCETWFGDKLNLLRHAKSCKSGGIQQQSGVSIKQSQEAAPTIRPDADQLASPAELNRNMALAVETVIASLQGDSTRPSNSSRKNLGTKKRLGAAAGVIKAILRKNGSDSKDQQRGQCGKCGRWYADKWSLHRHTVKKSCMSAETEALWKLNATLDFICQFCNRDMKERGALEWHVASCHRFLHENAREYQHLDIKKGEAATLFFCPLCGFQKASRKEMAKHFRASHKESFGVPKNNIQNGRLDGLSS